MKSRQAFNTWNQFLPQRFSFALVIIFLLPTPLLFSGDVKGGYGFTFDTQTYHYRWFNESQHEFTPTGQENLDLWEDMVTINYYPTVSTQSQIDQLAPVLLSNYKKSKAIVLRADKLTRPDLGNVEYLIVCLIPSGTFFEFVEARLAVSSGVGYSLIYSKNLRKEPTKEAINAWLGENAGRIEHELMSFSPIPSNQELLDSQTP